MPKEAYLGLTCRVPKHKLTTFTRMTSGLMLKIIYGYNIEPHGSDTLMDLVNLSMSQFAQAVEPGAWLVDSFPPRMLSNLICHKTPTGNTVCLQALSQVSA